jgi:anti-sigma factor RsiW
MIDCSTLIRDFSDYRDGLMEPSRAASVEAHLRECESCSRYADVVERGVDVYRGFSTIEPSPDFLSRLEDRLHLVDLEARRAYRPDSSLASSGVVVLLVLLMAAAAWAPVVRLRTPVHSLPPIAAHAPEPPSAIYSFFRQPTLVVPPAGSYRTGSSVVFRNVALEAPVARNTQTATPR